MHPHVESLGFLANELQCRHSKINTANFLGVLNIEQIIHAVTNIVRLQLHNQHTTAPLSRRYVLCENYNTDRENRFR